MDRCTKCLLPENYPGIKFNDEGICNHCLAHKERKYLGGEALKEKINAFLYNKQDRNQDYDCVIGFSGGRDSTYLLYYLAKILNLRVVAYCADNGFIPEQTMLNMKKTADIVKAKLVIEKHTYQEDCIKHHIQSWMHKPSAAMVGMVCTGCRLGIDIGMFNYARKSKIPVVISGGSPFEGKHYKFNIMKTNPNSKKKSSAMLGYLSQIIKNPKWIMNFKSVITQLKEYYYHYFQNITKKKKDLLLVSPFYSYIRWEEEEIVAALENELDWKKNPNTESTWRGDCYIALLKLDLYKKTLGFNDKDDGLSDLIRDKQISREEALERLSKEQEISEESHAELFEKIGLDYSDLKSVLEKL